jgi:hypothetical protein
MGSTDETRAAAREAFAPLIRAALGVLEEARRAAEATLVDSRPALRGQVLSPAAWRLEASPAVLELERALRELEGP